MRWKPFAAAAGVAAAVAALLAGCPSSEAPVHVHGRLRATLLHTSDMHSRIFPYDVLVSQSDASLGLGAEGAIVNVGGAARISHILGRERARADRVAHIDGGDCFQGAPVFNFFSGEAEMRAVAQMGADAMVIANHEFDRGGLNVATQIQKWATFPVLAANYKLESLDTAGTAGLARVLSPYTVVDMDGLKVLVLGMGNLSSITSVFDQPNKLGITPLNTADVTQFYVDLMRPMVDLVVLVTHLGLESDQRMIEQTEGIDVVLGGHNHIVLQPPKTVEDCACVDEKGQHFIEVPSSAPVDPDGPVDPTLVPGDPCRRGRAYVRRSCTPRPVVLAHSGAFAKYVGRLDLVVSDRAGDFASYASTNGFEVLDHAYQLFPVTDAVPEDPAVAALLEPYALGLQSMIDLELLVGYAPDGSKRSAPSGGDSPLGNLVATAAWLRQGVQTDFALTNSTGIRTDMVPGPVTVEQMFNIFPFDNSITKMQLSGVEVRQLFDFVARRSASRGCTSQAQIAGARLAVRCQGCATSCQADGDCPTGSACVSGSCSPAPACASEIYVGSTDRKCASNADCNVCRADVGRCATTGEVCKADADCPSLLVACDTTNVDADGLGRCGKPIDPIGSYELATSNYLAAGGSGYRVLQRNTTQFDTKIQQRDALIDYVRQGKPCGYDPALTSTGGLRACTLDAECGTDGAYVCACAGGVTEDATSGACTTMASGCPGAKGRCVLSTCRAEVAAFHRRHCAETPDAKSAADCVAHRASCSVAGEECKYLSCVDRRIGNFSDGRILMEGH